MSDKWRVSSFSYKGNEMNESLNCPLCLLSSVFNDRITNCFILMLYIFIRSHNTMKTVSPCCYFRVLLNINFLVTLPNSPRSVCLVLLQVLLANDPGAAHGDHGQADNQVFQHSFKAASFVQAPPLPLEVATRLKVSGG